MSGFLNTQGTLNTVFSLGKGDDLVILRSNAGIFETKNFGGEYLPLVSIDDSSTVLTKTWSSNKISSFASDASNISTGSLTDSVLSSNVPLKNTENTFTETNIFPQVGIGSSSFDTLNPESLLIDLGTNGSTSSIAIKSNNDVYVEMNIQNTNNGTSVSSDYVATADNGTVSSNYIDMGINSSEYTDNYVGVANDGYLYTDGGNMCIGTVTAGKDLVFFTNGSDSYDNEKLRISYDGISTFQNHVIVPDGHSNNHAVNFGQLQTKQNSLGDISGIVKGDGLGAYTNAVSGTDYLTPTGNGSGLTNLTKTQVGLSNVPNTDCSTTVNITDSSNKRFVTDAEKTILSNTSGTNTGDETTNSIKNKLGVASASNSGYLSMTDWSTFNSKLSTVTGTSLDSVFTSNGLLVRTGTGTYSVDTNTYLTSSSNLNASNINTGTVGDSYLSSSVTLQGNIFNGASQLVQLNSSTQYPAKDGSLITNLTKTQVGLGNVPNVDTSNATNITSGTLADDRLSSVITKQGNTFNGNSQLVQLNSSGYFPALNGSLITNLTKTQVGLSNVDNVQQLPISYLDTDGTLSSNSDTKVPSQKAIKTYVDRQLTTITTSTTLTNSHNEVLVNGDLTDVTITVPLASTLPNKEYLIKHIGGATVIITSASFMDNVSTITLVVPTSLIRIKSDGSVWRILEHYSPLPQGGIFVGSTEGFPRPWTITGDGTFSSTGVFTLNNNVVTTTKMATISAGTYLGNNTGSPTNPIAISTNTAFNRDFETSTSNIKANGTVSVGTSNNIARADHVHPISNRNNGDGSYVETKNTTSQTITSGGVLTRVNYNSLTQDYKGEFNISTNRFTSNSIQTVLVSATLIFPSMSNSTYRQNNIYIYKNGAEMYRVTTDTNISFSAQSAYISFPIQMWTNDYIEIYASTANPSNINISGARLVINQLY